MLPGHASGTFELPALEYLFLVLSQNAEPAAPERNLNPGRHGSLHVVPLNLYCKYSFSTLPRVDPCDFMRCLMVRSDTPSLLIFSFSASILASISPFLCLSISCPRVEFRSTVRPQAFR